MILKEDILADFHTHTTFSLHAYSSVKENIDEAVKKGLKYLVISDHFYNIGSNIERNNEVNRIKYLGERVNTPCSPIQVIGSAEFNLGHHVSDLYRLMTLKWKPVGVHSYFYNIKGKDLEALKYDIIASCDGDDKSKFNAIVHLERELHKIDYGKHGRFLTPSIKNFLDFVVLYSKNNNVFLEVNESSLTLEECGSVDRLRYWLKKAKRNKNMIYLGSDAHYCTEVGLFTGVLELLNEVNYPKELILNCNPELIERYI